MGTAPWAKIWWTWYTSRSHIGLSGVALALGAPLMLICRECAARNSDAHSDGVCDGVGDGSGAQQSDLVWLLDKAGKPITAARIAAIARFPVPDVEAALVELLDVETLIVTTDGTYGFPNFWKYQETASAARMRKKRGAPARNSDAHSDAHSDGNSDASCDGKRVEGRGKRIPLATQEGESARGAPPVVPDFTSGVYLAHFREVFAAEAGLMGFKAPPDPTVSQLRSGAKRAGAYARATRIPFEQACVELARSALEAQRATGKDAGLHLLSIEPGQSPSSLRHARAGPSPGTTGKDFEDEEDESVQIARMQRGAK